MKGVHIYLSSFENESRILKQTKGLIDHKIFSKIIVIALWKEGLPVSEQFGDKRFVFRLKPRFFSFIPPRGLGRIFQYFRFIELLLLLFRKIRKEKPDCINLHQVLLLPFTRIIQLSSPKSKLIYDAHELETETNGLKGVRKKLLKYFERVNIHRFTHIFVVSPSIEQWYRREYSISNVSTVLNCPRPQLVQKHNYFREELGISIDSFIYLYQGALFKGRGIEILIDAFKELNDPKFSIVFMGYGECETTIVEASKQSSNIFFYKAVAPDIVLNYTASADFGVSLIENVCLSYYYCLPNKVFEYLMAGLPCIVSDMPELRAYVENNKVGIVCESGAKESIIKSVMEIAALDQRLLRQAVTAAQVKYNWSNEEEKMIEVYRGLF